MIDPTAKIYLYLGCNKDDCFLTEVVDTSNFDFKSICVCHHIDFYFTESKM